MNMKGPSLDAIKRFKEQQEQRKREENEKKIKEKLNTLEHRSTQGDRKAKQVLKKIRDTIDKPPPPPPAPSSGSSSNSKRGSSRDTSNQHRPKSKPKPAETDFEELMKLAKQNNNQIREKPPPPPPPEPVKIPKKKPSNPTPVVPARPNKPKQPTEPVRSNKEPRDIPQVKRNVALPTTSRSTAPKGIPPRGGFSSSRNYPPPRNLPPSRNLPPQGLRRPMPSTSRYEDDYESDGFVVSDEDDDARAELTETLRSVFRYDRRRCDLREEELDRQYRAIGNVSTFEDLEREERRASRLAAAEDARALREEEERKRLKKLRLEKAYSKQRG